MESLSSAEKDTITREIKAEISRLITGCEHLDMGMAFDMFLDAPDFLMMGTDGTLCDFNTYLKNNIDYLNTCAGFELTTFKEEIRILGPETAIFSWAYGVEATLKKGKMDIIENAGASFIFRKMDGKWKVVYYHESSVPPKRISRMQ